MANKKNTLQVVVGSILILLLIGVTVLLISEKRANNELVQELCSLTRVIYACRQAAFPLRTT